MTVLSKMSRQAKLYQRLRTKGYPWVVCEIGKNGMPKPHAGAFQFGVRYTLDGERMLETFKALDEAEAARRERDVRLYASKNAVAFLAAVVFSSNRITVADAVTQYLSDKAAEGKDHKTISAYTASIKPAWSVRASSVFARSRPAASSHLDSRCPRPAVHAAFVPQR